MDYYRNLVDRKQEIEHLIKRKRENLQVPLSEASDELSHYDQHPADGATDLFEREKDLGLLEMLEMQLEKVNYALNQYKQGHYGICSECGREIEAARLERLVNTRLCAECAQKQKAGYQRPAEEDVISASQMTDMGEAFQVGGFEFYEK